MIPCLRAPARKVGVQFIAPLHRFWFCLAVLTLLLAGLGRVAQAQEIMKVSDIHPGMKGYGLTVFSGTKPERFNIEVIGVLHNALPKQDMILIRSDDPRLLHS